MTPSDEAVERGARALADVCSVGPGCGPFEPGYVPDTRRELYRRKARAVLDAAFPSGEQPGGEKLYVDAHAQIGDLRGMCTDEEPHTAIDRKLSGLDDLLYHELRGSSGEYQRAVSDVVEALRTDDARELVRYEIDKTCTGGTDEDWIAAERSTDDLAHFIERRFAPTGEGEE